MSVSSLFVDKTIVTEQFSGLMGGSVASPKLIAQQKVSVAGLGTFAHEIRLSKVACGAFDPATERRGFRSPLADLRHGMVHHGRG
jgi:hypothetical protein